MDLDTESEENLLSFKSVHHIHYIQNRYGVISAPQITSEMLVQMGCLLIGVGLYNVMQAMITVMQVRYPEKTYQYLSKWYVYICSFRCFHWCLIFFRMIFIELHEVSSRAA